MIEKFLEAVETFVALFFLDTAIDRLIERGEFTENTKAAMIQRIQERMAAEAQAGVPE